jgi:hypothetical protein
MAQTLFKHIWQRAVERRDQSGNPPPAFLWCDESQYFLTRYDPVFQMTSRSARVMTVHLTQSVPGLHGAIGRSETDALLANLGTRIWHRNSCTVTNAAAAETVARSRQLRFSTGTATSDDSGGDPRVSRTMSGSGIDRTPAPAGGVSDARERGAAARLHCRGHRVSEREGVEHGPDVHAGDVLARTEVA